MAEAVPAVALLFDDAGLGEQLRTALSERGARIVHEGPLSGLSRELVASLDADVMVVNLDDEDDGALDRLDEALDGDRPRVVFNDAQASRALQGWDRARWARHLAMKVLAAGDADPPRPPAVEPVAEAAPVPVVAPPVAVADETPAPPAEDEEARQAAASETLAAELEALLASDTTVADAEDFGSGLNYAAGEGSLLHDGDFGAPPEDDAVETIAPVEAAREPEPEPVAVAAAAEPVTEPVARGSFQLDHLELAPLDDAQVATVPRAASAAPAATRVSDSWTLLDPDTPAETTSGEAASPAMFGIQKMSAADFLAPEGEAAESPIKPGLSLELVSMEEAIAPQHYEPAPQASDEAAEPLSRLVVLGATTESTESVGQFLAALPAGLPVVVLHTQHLAGRPADGLVDYFAAQCALPVRLAETGMRVRAGEVVVVPSDRQVRLQRDGTVELDPVAGDAAHVPSIDASFTLAASTFGREVVAIVFAGRSTDAVGGCQAVHDRGGQVWVEAVGGAHASDMVSGVLAERLSHYAGTPRELAARLAEHFLEGER
ncbi:chemotaxis protein CheB [Fulvimonas yonginensis]|uniref:protein-glutamate methylesterase n=1 Tax=Fulvimonas yonginensis TaxID=1495200 RepID=A0ABU8J9Y2_9GAMM